MPADYSGTRPQPGFWVWSKKDREFFWFRDPHSAEYWRQAWADMHGEGVYEPCDTDSFTPKLFS